MADQTFSTDKGQIENYDSAPVAQNGSSASNVASQAPDTSNSPFRDFNELRIVKDSGFFGITIPVHYVMMAPVSHTTTDSIYPYQCVFFIANRPYKVIQISERHEIAGTGGGGCSIYVLKVPNGVGAGAGTRVMTGFIDLQAAANTLQTITTKTPTNFVNNDASSSLATGDALCCTITNVPTGVYNMCLSVLLRAV